MSWKDVDSNKATEKQIEYAEALLEAVYGEIIKPVRNMTKQEISKVIDETKMLAEELGIDYGAFFTSNPNHEDRDRRRNRY